MTLIRKITIISFSLTAVLIACTKNNVESNVSTHHLESWQVSSIYKGQAIEVYDATALNDSLSMAVPPTHRYYNWKSLPDDGCITYWGNYRHGLAYLTFNCAGEYRVFANVFDSATQMMIGATDTFIVNVNNETLLSSQPLKSDDILQISPSIVKMWHVENPSDPFPSTRPPDEIYISLGYVTTHQYQYANNEVNVTPSLATNNYSYAFADSVNLSSYPFSYSNDFFGNVGGGLRLENLTYGVPANLSIRWLGNTYTGKVTLLNEYDFSIEWDNSGPVKINQSF